MSEHVLADETRKAFAEAEIESDRGGVEVALDHVREQYEALQIVLDRLVSRIEPILDQQPRDGDALASEAQRPTSELAAQIDSHAEDLARLAEHMRRILGRVDL